MPTTLKDVASRAKVTVSTVSRILNSSKGQGGRKHTYSEETKRRVLNAAQKLDYRPNMVARGFRLKKSFSVGILTADLSDPLISLELQELENLLGEKGYRVLLGFTNSKKERLKEYVQDFLSRGIDGLVMVFHSAVGSDGEFRELKAIFGETPLVGLGSLRGTGISYVDIDRREGTYQLIRHMLAEHGHREIALFGYPMPNITLIHRLEGYRHAFAEFGIEVDGNLLFYDQPEGLASYQQFEMGRRQVQNCLDRLGRPPRVIFASNDLKAVAVIRELSQRGFSVPHDVAVVGFDGIAIGAELSVGLTTVRQPEKRIAQAVVDMIIQFIEQGMPEQPKEIILKPELIIRESCGCNHSGSANI
ncbi:MAG: LacI family DNA-binding transcriptional regulator [Planctomycetota bacterium]